MNKFIIKLFQHGEFVGYVVGKNNKKVNTSFKMREAFAFEDEERASQVAKNIAASMEGYKLTFDIKQV